MIRLWDLFWYGYSHERTYTVLKEINDFSNGANGKPGSIIIVSRCDICGKIIQNRIG